MALKQIKQTLQKELDEGHSLDQIFYRKDGKVIEVGAIVITGPNFMTDAKRVYLGNFPMSQYKAFSQWHREQMRRVPRRRAV